VIGHPASPWQRVVIPRVHEQGALPQARRLCSAKGYGRKTLAIVNALIHWHAPLINCDWLPPIVQKLVHSFRDDPLFCFEVSVTFLTNFFAEWTSDFPGPPPEVLSRIDAIFSTTTPTCVTRSAPRSSLGRYTGASSGSCCTIGTGLT
jgi:hypothetical protein